MKSILAVILFFVFSIAKGAGFDSYYTAHTGDLNNDGRTDIYLKWNPQLIFIDLDGVSVPIAQLPQGVAKTVLLNNGNGAVTITPVTQSSDVTAVNAWPKSSVIKLQVGDYNIDGVADLIVTNVAAAISGLLDQVVLASNANNAAPQYAKAMDSSFKAFFTQVTNWINTPTTQVTASYPHYFYLKNTPSQSPVPIECQFTPNAFADDCLYQLDDENDPGFYYPNNDPNSPDVWHWWLIDYWTETRAVRNYQPQGVYPQLFTKLLNQSWESGRINNSSATIFRDILDQIYGASVVNNLIVPYDVYATADQVIKETWRDVRLVGSLFGIMFSECLKTSGVQAYQCFVDLAAPGLSPLQACPNGYVITSNQQTQIANQQRRPFWLSRYGDSCDPVAPMALAIIDDVGLGAVSNRWLRNVASAQSISINEQQIGLDLMEAHAQATTQDSTSVVNLLSNNQVTEYHQEVFQSHGLPKYVFGGAPLGTSGAMSRAWRDATGWWIWCNGCDVRP